MRNYPPFPRATPHLRTDCPRVPHPSATVAPESAPFDLHALGTPPALILSQDQTLHHCLLCHASTSAPCRRTSCPAPPACDPGLRVSVSLASTIPATLSGSVQGLPQTKPTRFTPSSAHVPTPSGGPSTPLLCRIRQKPEHMLRPAPLGTGISLPRREPADNNDLRTQRQGWRKVEIRHGRHHFTLAGLGPTEKTPIDAIFTAQSGQGRWFAAESIARCRPVSGSRSPNIHSSRRKSLRCRRPYPSRSG